MRYWSLAAVALLMVNAVEAFDSLTQCNAEYTYMSGKYEDCKEDIKDLEDDLDNLNDTYKDLKKDCDKNTANITDYKIKLDSCISQHDADNRVNDEKEKRITDLNTQLASKTTSLDAAQKKLDLFDSQRLSELTDLNEKINFLDQQVRDEKANTGKAEIQLAKVSAELNNTKLQLLGTCNVHQVSYYYEKWRNLNADEKTCLTHIMEHERVAYLTIGLETKYSIMTMCKMGSDVYKASRYLKKFKDLGFIEADTSVNYNIDPNLDKKVQELLELAGVFKPVNLLGCMDWFNSLDKSFSGGRDDGSSWLMFWEACIVGFFGTIIVVARRYKLSF